MAWLLTRFLVLAVATLSFVACGGSSGGGNPPPPVIPPPVQVPPIQFHCAKDSTCPEVLVAGDPFAETNAVPDGFRGYADPSLEYDVATGTLWMTYSWLNVQISNPGPPVVFDLGVRTHLARSDDNGATFTFVRAVNNMAMEAHPDTGAMGWSVHEVSTLVREPSGLWQVLWLKYFDPFGTVAGVDERQEFLYWKTTATDPTLLGDNGEVWAKSLATSASWGAPIDMNSIPELADCVLQSEPGLFAFSGETYLASSCLVADASGRRTDLERLVLLRQTATGYSFVGNLLDAQDAIDLGVDVIEQADIAIARDGSVILIVTPIVLNADPSHQGCIVLEFSDFSSAMLERDVNGVAVPRAVITADGNGLGPGLCSYDADSDTGVLLVISTITQGGTDVEFSLRATGVHP